MKEKKLPNTRIAVADGLVNLELAAVLVYP